MGKRQTVILLIVVLAIINLALTARAQASITVRSFENVVEFGEQIDFLVEIEAEVSIDSAELIFQENGALDTLVIPAVLEAQSSDSVRATATLDLTRYALTPFARGFYVWRIIDRMGGVLETDPLLFQYDDNRFAWEKHSRENINLYTYNRPTEQIQAALNQAIIAQSRIAQPLQLAMPALIEIYLYNNVEDLRSALNLHGRDIIEAYADPRHNVILLSAPPTYAELNLRRQLPHELAHIYIGNYAYEQFVPAWLVEGLALYFETEPDADLHAHFEKALQDDALYPLEALCPAFPAEDRTSFELAYAQSHEIVRYIEQRYGPRGLRRLLDAYAEGASCRGGVAQGLGISLDALEGDWLLSLNATESPGVPLALWPWLVLLVVFITWPVVFVTFGRRRDRIGDDSSRSNHR